MNLKTGVSRKQSTPNIPKNEHFLHPDTITYVCVSGGKKFLVFGKFGVPCFLETTVLRFALLPYYPRFGKPGLFKIFISRENQRFSVWGFTQNNIPKIPPLFSFMEYIGLGIWK